MSLFRQPREDFLSTYYEKNFYFQRAISKIEFSLSELNRVLFAWNILDGRLKLRAGDWLPLESFAESIDDLGEKRARIVKEKFYLALRQGATLVMNRLELRLPQVADLTSMVGRYVGERVVANGYFAVSGSGAFPRHWDTHDVFAIQLVGAKRWRLYRPTVALPVQNQPSRNATAPATDLMFDQVLEAGDILYVPRGWWHDATPVVGQPTFHIAVGVHVPRVRDFAAWVCVNRLPELLAARQSIKFEEDEVVLDDVINGFSQELRDPNNLARFKQELVDQERVDQPFELERLVSAQPVSPGTVHLNSSFLRPLKKTGSVVNGASLMLKGAGNDALIQSISSTGELSLDAGISATMGALVEDLIEREVLVRRRDRELS